MDAASRTFATVFVVLFLSHPSHALEMKCSDPAFVNSTATSDSGGDHTPRVATDGDGVWIAVWRSEAGLSGTGTDGDIFCARLVDNGLSWSSPVLVNTNGMSDSGFDSSPVIANDRNGNWIVAWFAGGAETDNDILASHSGNNGASWSAPTLVNSTGLSDTQHDDYPLLQPMEAARGS